MLFLVWGGSVTARFHGGLGCHFGLGESLTARCALVGFDVTARFGVQVFTSLYIYMQSAGQVNLRFLDAYKYSRFRTPSTSSSTYHDQVSPDQAKSIQHCL